jgi:hypothetical protein
MLPHTAFAFSGASLEQAIAFFGFAIFTIAFFVWIAYLVRMK